MSTISAGVFSLAEWLPVLVLNIFIPSFMSAILSAHPVRGLRGWLEPPTGLLTIYVPRSVRNDIVTNSDQSSSPWSGFSGLRVDIYNGKANFIYISIYKVSFFFLFFFCFFLFPPNNIILKKLLDI